MIKAKQSTAAKNAMLAPAPAAPVASALRGIPLRLRALVAQLGQPADAKQLRRLGLEPPANGRTGIAPSKTPGLTARVRAGRLSEIRLTQAYAGSLPYRLAWRYHHIWLAERLLRAKAKPETRRGVDYRTVRKVIDPQCGLTFEWTMNLSKNTRSARFFLETSPAARRTGGRPPRGADRTWTWKRWVISGD